MPTPEPSCATRRPLARAAAGIEILGPMAGSGYREPPVLVRRGDGQMVQLSPLLAGVLGALDGTRDADAVADEVERTLGRELHPDDVAVLVAAKLAPLGLVQTDAGPGAPLRRSDPLLGLRGRIQLAGPARTDALARPFTWLFRPVVVAAVVAAFAAFASWVVVRHGLDTAIDEAIADPALLLGLIGLILASGAFHELGHAAACCYGGAQPRAMGAAVYLVWPAFYTDVTDSYRLDRRGRLRVDLGGLYFNAVFTLVTGVAWVATGTEALLVLVPVQLLQMSRQLIPIVRFDGYHILADLVGVPDLFARIRPTLARVVPGRRPDVPNPLTGRAQVVVVTWVAVVVPFLLGSLALLLWNLPGIVTGSLASLRLQWDLFTDNLTAGRLAAAALGIVAMATVALLPASAAYLSTRIAHRSGARLWSATDGRPVLRAATLSVVVVALLAAAGPLVPSPDRAPADLAGSVVDDGVTELAAGTSTGVDLPSRRTPKPSASIPAPAVHAESTAVVEPVAEPVMVALAAPTVTPEAVVPTVRSAWPFSFPRPALPGPTGNQALAVGTVDGATEVALSTSLQWLVDQPIRTRNEAWAVAQCVGCRTVAVAFQIVAASGDVSTAVPENLAVSVNEVCEDCVTGAAAVQLAVTLVEQPPQPVKAQVNRIVERVNGLRGALRTATLDEVLAVLDAARAEALALLDPWIVDAADQVEGGGAIGEEDPESGEALADGEDAAPQVEDEAGSTQDPAPTDPETTGGTGTGTDAVDSDHEGTADATEPTSSAPSDDQAGEDAATEDQTAADAGMDAPVGDDQAPADDDSGDPTTAGTAAA